MLAPKEAASIEWVHPGKGESGASKLSQRASMSEMGPVLGDREGGGGREGVDTELLDDPTGTRQHEDEMVGPLLRYRGRQGQGQHVGFSRSAGYRQGSSPDAGDTASETQKELHTPLYGSELERLSSGPSDQKDGLSSRCLSSLAYGKGKQSSPESIAVICRVPALCWTLRTEWGTKESLSRPHEPCHLVREMDPQ